jgi:glycosyltransferase involved in cell wall biosynthesis
MSPSVSIIIPVYNYERYVAEAIESALAQTYADCEVVVVDDGSTDGSAEIARGYGERARLISKRNAGLSAARNTGIEESRGELLVFLDADDRLMPGMVEYCVRTLRELPAEFGLLAVGTVKINADGERCKVKNGAGAEPFEVTAPDLLVRNHFVPLVMARREVFEVCGMFDPSLESSEDRDMWIRAATRYRIWRSREVYAEKRQHGKNMSSNAGRQSENIERVLRKAELAYDWFRRDRALRLRAWSFYYYQSALIYSGVPRVKVAVWRLAKSLALWPFSFATEQVHEVPFFRVRVLVKNLMRLREELGKPGVGEEGAQ